jgi:hypothetical protein
MTAHAVEVPASYVDQARRHLAKTGLPLLVRDRRRRSDLELVAMLVNRGYVLAVGPETPVAQFYVAMSHRYPARDLGADLCSVAVAGLEELPRQFMCEGSTVGLWEVIQDTVCVRGPVALSCLSWTLRDRRVGFYLTLSEAETE